MTSNKLYSEMVDIRQRLWIALLIVDFSSLFKTRLRSLFPSSQLRFEVRKLGGNFAANFKTNFRTLKQTSEVQSTHGVTYVMACEELTDFLGNIEQKIGKESYEIITNTLRHNFTSRLSLKLPDPENLDVIFAKRKLPLGSRKILDYHLGLLRNESPLSKPKPQRTDPACEESSADSKPKVRHCFTQNSCKYKSTYSFFNIAKKQVYPDTKQFTCSRQHFYS